MKVCIELSVPDMTGDGVSREIELSLGGVEGVEYAHVNRGAAKVTVEFDDSRTSADQLIRTLETLGFHPAQL